MKTENTETIETPEHLAAMGWQRLTYAMGGDITPAGDVAEIEIMQDPDGGLWIVTDWHHIGGDGIPHAAARRRITREQARAVILATCIPDAFQADFRAAVAGDEQAA